MAKNIFKIAFLTILLGIGNFAFTEDKSCCAVAGGFTLSEEDKAVLQENKESKETKPQETSVKSSKERE